MFYLIVAAFLWGTSFIAGKYAYGMFEPVMLVQLRLAIAALFFLPIFVKRFSLITLSQWKSLLLLSFLIFPATFILQFVGLKYTSASSAATMIGIEPLMVVLIGSLFFSGTARKIDWLMAIVAFFGVALVVGESNSSEVTLYGCSLVLLSTVVVGFWIQLSKRLLTNMPSTDFTAITLVLGCILCLPFTILFTDTVILTPSKEGIFSLIYLGVGCSLLAAWLWNKGLQKSNANTGGIFLALEPVFGVTLAIWLLSENIPLMSYLGIGLVIVSAAVSMLYKDKTAQVQYS